MSLEILQGWRRGWALPDRRPIHDWARDFVQLGGGYARQGAFDIRTCRHLLEPFEAVADERVREVTCRAAIQTLKTLFVEICSLWAIANEPGPIMWTQQDDESAAEHVKGRYRNLLRNCEPVARLLPKNKHDAATCEIYFGDFYLIINGANLNNLQSKSIRWKLNSECWLWKQGLLTHARRRVSAYARDGISKILNESQGSHADDDFDRLWHEGTAQIWSVQCFGCQRFVPLEFFGRAADDPAKRVCVVWDEGARNENGMWDEQLVRNSTRWICPHCAHEHANSAATRARWNSTGRYSAPRADRDGKHRSFNWNAILAEDMGQLAVEFLQAGEFKKRGQINPLRDFYMQRLALPWRNEEAQLNRTTVELRGTYALADMHARGREKLENEARRMMTIDRQRDHFWAVVRAWKSDGGSQLLWRGKLSTTEQAEAIRQHFGVESQLCFQDAQFSTAHVYEDCIRFGWTALHGSGDDSFVHIRPNGQKVQKFHSSIKQTQVPGGYARYMFWASDPVKDVLAALVAGNSHAWECGADHGEEYARHLRGEVKRERISKSTGRSEWRWTKTGPNHMWDCEAMQVAVALALQLLPSPEKMDASTASDT
jgi:hypothetical protein